MAPIPPLASIPLVLTNAALNANTGVFAASARALAIAALFALAAALAARFGGEVFLVALSVDSCCGGEGGEGGGGGGGRDAVEGVLVEGV